MHMTMMVIINNEDDPMEQVEKLMAPYDENLEVTPYIWDCRECDGSGCEECDHTGKEETTYNQDCECSSFIITLFR